MVNPETHNFTLYHISVYYLHPSESREKLVPEDFGGTAYGVWKCKMIIALSRKSKLSFVHGKLPSLTGDIVELRSWDRVNNLVIGWLFTILDSSIANSVLWSIF